MTSFNPERLLAPVGLGNAASLTGWEPGTVAFPDLDDFVSLLNSGTQPQQQFASNLSPNGLPLDPLESLLLSAENNNVLTDVPQPPLDMDFIFGDVNPLFGSSASPVQSSSPLAQPDVSPLSQGMGRNAVSASPPGSVVPLPPSPASIHSQHSEHEKGKVVATAEPAAGGKKRKVTAEEKEEKDKRRAIRNRAAAQESRDKKKKYMEDLERTNENLSQQNQQLSTRLETVEATNSTLMQRLEELASQLTSLRSQFQHSTNPTASTSTSILPQQSITIPYNPSPASSTGRIPAADIIKLEDPDESFVIQHTNNDSGQPTRGATNPIVQLPFLFDTTTVPTDGNGLDFERFTYDSPESSDDGHISYDDTSLDSSSPTGLHRRDGDPALDGLDDLEDLWTPADGAVTGASNGSQGVLIGGKRKGLGLLPDLNGYVGLSPNGRLAKFPILRSIWEGKVGGKAVAV
ncbi:hypothetical protein HK097_006574 [Rhizophlyctis rosea]|uniref:BZIP domain-containing protein n=1 Tax=Rhizophlyctis rosea TaxID=64517 RepID=A0AAD5X536_9FUNG|nr:hypothetical protein HK097_006574 [Rhizophlyctis rosea]